MFHHLPLLLQMADSAFPVGGFAYSHGLESAMKQGFFRDQEALREYLVTYCEQLISFDFAFVSSAHGADAAAPDHEYLALLTKSYEAMLLNPPVQKANLVLGRNWMRICRQISGSARLGELENGLINHRTAFEFPVIFGLTSRAMEISLGQTLHLFFYMAVRDQVSAVIRLGIAGPARAQQELRHILQAFSEKIEKYIPVPYDKAYKTAWLLELAQLSHGKVYSKLFQN